MPLETAAPASAGPEPVPLREAEPLHALHRLTQETLAAKKDLQAQYQRGL